MRISDIKARQVFDSRANATVEVDVILADGSVGRGTVPSGASTGIYEVLELRDGGKELGGKSVRKAIGNVLNEIAPRIIGLDAEDQRGIDQLMIELDGTENKSRLGANAILGVSMAVARASAASRRVPLFRYLGGTNARTIPVPMIQIIGGGAHALHSEAVVNVYNATKKIFMELGRPTAIADEGGFWPSSFKTNEEGLEILTEGIRRAGYEPGVDLGIALDIASSEFYDKEKKKYIFHLENKEFSTSEFVNLLCSWVDKYPIVSIEDGTSELDWEGSVLITEKLGGRIQLIGDDLFTTNIERIRNGVKLGALNAVLIKMNQIGTITETMDAIEFTKNSGYLPVVSARSGETEDDTIVHLAIATNAGQLKVGSVARTERAVKWNEAIRMEELLGRDGVYPGKAIFDQIRK